MSVAVLFDVMLPITCSFLQLDKSIKAPCKLINEAIEMLQTEFKTPQRKKLKDFKKEAMIVLDEFQILFRYHDDDQYIPSKIAANEMAYFSRVGGTFGIISGSSTNM